ncbi:redoxin domain-containing protein [bacterium]|nr:redoxin domain-containing protein [bacterium]
MLKLNNIVKFLLVVLVPVLVLAQKKPDSKVKTENAKVESVTIDQAKFYIFTVKDAKGADVNLGIYKNKVVLVVNVASKCGYTNQYEGLQKLYENYQSKDFVILGFPSNQFFGQEPGSNDEIQKFCKLSYGVSFPVFAKVDVNGDDATDLYKWLTSLDKFSGKITWNFNKFLINKKGEVVNRYPSATKPEALDEDIKKLL